MKYLVILVLLFAVGAQADALRCDILGAQGQVLKSRTIMLNPSLNVLNFASDDGSVTINATAYGTGDADSFIVQIRENSPEGAITQSGRNYAKAKHTRCLVGGS